MSVVSMMSGALGDIVSTHKVRVEDTARGIGMEATRGINGDCAGGGPEDRATPGAAREAMLERDSQRCTLVWHYV